LSGSSSGTGYVLLTLFFDSSNSRTSESSIALAVAASSAPYAFIFAKAQMTDKATKPSLSSCDFRYSSKGKDSSPK